AFKWITENLGPVHVLVNNAGFGKLGSLLDDDTQMWKSVFNVNVLGLCMATREAVRIMKVNNIKGHIIHINSMGGHKVAPLSYECNVYTASKFAVTALTETLRLELN
ncbi:adh short domain containing protein, partial [Asbolus verrucosus]